MKMKTKQRFKQLQPNLKGATTNELFTELMKRLEYKKPAICYFVDKTSLNGSDWNIHLAGGEIVAHTESIK